MIEILAPNTSFSIRLDFVCVCCCMVRMTSEQPLFHVTTHMDACVVLMAEHLDYSFKFAVFGSRKVQLICSIQNEGETLQEY